MTPQDMMDEYLRTLNTDFLGERDIFELLDFLDTHALQLSGSWTDYEFMIRQVAAELRAEREADWDTWNNLLALDKEIEQEWIDELTYLLTQNWSPILNEINQYLRDRKQDA